MKHLIGELQLFLALFLGRGNMQTTSWIGETSWHTWVMDRPSSSIDKVCFLYGMYSISSMTAKVTERCRVLT